MLGPRKNGAVEYEEAMAVLRGWDGRDVLVVAFLEPGVSLRPFAGVLACEPAGPATLRGTVRADGAQPVRIAFPAGTFHDAAWVPGRAQRGLSVVQGATRVDVFVED